MTKKLYYTGKKNRCVRCGSIFYCDGNCSEKGQEKCKESVLCIRCAVRGKDYLTEEEMRKFLLNRCEEMWKIRCDFRPVEKEEVMFT